MTATVAEPVATAQDLRAVCDRDELLAALRFAGRAVPSRPPLPILGGVLLRAEGGQLHVTAYDYEVHAGAAVPAAGGRGTALVYLRTLQPMIAVLPKGCEVSLRVEDSHLRIAAADVVYTIPLLPIDDHPKTPARPATYVATMTGADLQHLARALSAVGRDASLPILTTVLLEVVAGGHLTAVATDRYRMAVVASEVSTALDVGTKLLLPGWLLRFVASAFKKDRQVSLYVDQADIGDAGVEFGGGGRVIGSKVLAGPSGFPKYASLLPSSFEGTATAPADVLSESLQQVAIAAERNTPVGITPAGGALHLRTGLDEDPSVGVTAAKTVRADLTGNPCAIAFNPAYLLDGIRACAAGDAPVELALQETTKPAVLSAPGDPSFRYLIMPVRRSS